MGDGGIGHIRSLPYHESVAALGDHRLCQRGTVIHFRGISCRERNLARQHAQCVKDHRIQMVGGRGGRSHVIFAHEPYRSRIVQHPATVCDRRVSHLHLHRVSHSEGADDRKARSCERLTIVLPRGSVSADHNAGIDNQLAKDRGNVVVLRQGVGFQGVCKCIIHNIHHITRNAGQIVDGGRVLPWRKAVTAYRHFVIIQLGLSGRGYLPTAVGAGQYDIALGNDHIHIALMACLMVVTTHILASTGNG